jgi:hypothetical protein
MARARPAALGFRHHSGWAVAVAVAGEPQQPDLLIRRRIDLSSRGAPRQVYHAVRNRPLALAAERIAAAKAAARERAVEEIRGLVAELDRMRFTAVVAALAADVRKLPPLERILSAHVLWHSAEGDLFREAIAEAAADLDLAVVQLPPSELESLASADLELNAQSLKDLLARLGKVVGPPWQQDQRQATVAAMLALASTTSPVGLRDI